MNPRSFRSPFGAPAAALLAAATLVLAACGGGESPSGAGATPAAAVSPSTEKATAWTSGPISGFGSVIVNGVRFDDTAAVVSDDSDRPQTRERLKLGMMVEVDGASVSAAAGIGRALRIRFGSEIVGPVSARDAAAGTLVVLGQTVVVTDTTAFDDSLAGGLAGVAIGQVVEVHALFDAGTGTYRATRIEDEAGATAYKLRGVVSGLDTAARTFVLGGQKIAYGGVPPASLPAQLADGMRVRVTLQTAQVDGAWVATSVSSRLRAIDDRSAGHVRGAITAVTGANGFEIDGLKVDTTRAAFPDGRDGIVVGARVEVEGAIVGGVLMAAKVELDDRHAPQRHAFELHGPVASLNATARTFVLRGVTVDWSGPVVWRDGSAATLADGARIEVKGIVSADRTKLVATRISFED
jgi:hypothetical protein